jgi:flagellin-like hook-associated protein FlgL
VGGRWQIFSADADGTNKNVVQLTTAGDNYSPQWSSEYDKLIFMSTQAGSWELFSMMPDGSNKTRLTNNPAFDHFLNVACPWQTIIKTMTVQIGPNDGDSLSFVLRPTMPVNLGIDALNVSSSSFASTSVDRIDTAIDKLNAYRSEIQTVAAGLQRFSNSRQSEKHGLENNVSTIVNTDDALEQATKIKASITQYVAAASIIHSNLISQKASEFLIGTIGK